MTIETTDYDAVIQAIRQWPAAKRFTLVQEVLQTLAPPTTASAPRPYKRTSQQALGIAVSSQPAPTDEDVQHGLKSIAARNRRMKALLDTNVVLDVLLARQPWVVESKAIWDACDD